MIAVYLEDAYREVVGDDLAEKFKKGIIEYGREVYEKYRTTLQEAHKKLPEQHARRLDKLLQEINNSYKNESTSLDQCSWMDIFKSLPVYYLMYSIANSIIKHAERNGSEKIPNVLEYLSKPEVYGTLLTIYIQNSYGVLEEYKDQLSDDDDLEQIIHLKESNDTQKYMEAMQNYIQKVIESIRSTFQNTSNYIENIIDKLLNVVLEHKIRDKPSEYS
jgi:hypothetical protein